MPGIREAARTAAGDIVSRIAETTILATLEANAA
jgi:hypothetical protein